MARKVLLADDSVTAQNMGRKILVDAGYDVLTVNNGSAALKRITESKPDLIVLDVYMPGYSGLEVCQRLKDSPVTAHIPVLLSVGKLEPFKPQEARRVKADAHIVKPFEASELLSAIARLEDQMVPQSRGSGFCSPLASVAEFGSEEVSANTGTNIHANSAQKNRLYFSSPNNEGSEAEPRDGAAHFRDFRKAKKKLAAAASSPAGSGEESAEAPETIPSPAEEAAPMAETAVVSAQTTEASVPQLQNADPAPDTLRDITPAELDALSAVAARLEQPNAEPESTPAADAGPATELEVKAPPVEATESAAVAWSEAGIPADQVEPATEVAAAQQPCQVTSLQAEIPVVQEVPATAVVDTALLAEAPAPIDQQDEPMFASAPAEEEIETPTAEQKEVSDRAPETDELNKPESISVETAAATVVSAEPEEPVEEEVAAPSDEELAQALSLLTPATVHPAATMPAEAMLVSAGSASQVSAQSADVNLTDSSSDEATGDSSAGTRWMAEAVGLTAEESAMSLEEEMFRTFAANPAAAPAGEIDSAPVVNIVSTIKAAVENRLAGADLAVAETATQVERAPDEAPKAMAAAATAESSAAPSTSEASDIASIVDRVLADLRPKIVEEIAKSLGKR